MVEQVVAGPAGEGISRRFWTADARPELSFATGARSRNVHLLSWEQARREQEKHWEARVFAREQVAIKCLFG